MLIEAFSEAKDPTAPEANEDALVVLPGRAYAVIDGVSDRTGQRYDGMLAGRYAARLVQRRLEQLLADDLPPAEAVVSDLTATIAAAHARFGVAGLVAGDWGGRLATTLALALMRADSMELVLIGDSGIRLDGTRLLRLEKDLDRITALLRRAAWQLVAARSDDPSARERLSRAVAFHGTSQDAAGLAPLLDPEDLADIAEDTRSTCSRELPHIAVPVVTALIERGIVGGQGRHQNNPTSPLGYSCLDGTAIPAQFMRIESVPRTAETTIELFTDGYFKPAEGFGVLAWEAAFRDVEETDPAKVLRYLSPRGSCGGVRADDRTYLGVKL